MPAPLHTAKGVAKTVVGGAFTIIGSTAVMAGEVLMFSPNAGEGSDCPGCIMHN